MARSGETSTRRQQQDNVARQRAAVLQRKQLQKRFIAFRSMHLSSNPVTEALQSANKKLDNLEKKLKAELEAIDTRLSSVEQVQQTVNSIDAKLEKMMRLGSSPLLSPVAPKSALPVV